MVRIIGSTFLPSKCPKCNSKVKVRKGLMMYISYCENCKWELKHEN